MRLEAKKQRLAVAGRDPKVVAARGRLSGERRSLSLALAYPGQSQDAADVLGDDQRGSGSRHGHVEQVQLVCWDFS